MACGALFLSRWKALDLDIGKGLGCVGAVVRFLQSRAKFVIVA